MNQFSDKQIKKALAPYVIAADANLCSQIRTYITLLLKWNETISLTTVTDPAEILRFHFGESLFALSAVPLRESRLADVGPGAGFPGMALAMASPSLDVTLIESNLRKCVFLAEVARSVNIPNAEILRSRVEDLPAGTSPFDFITARAVGHHDSLLAWAKLHLTKSGALVLWLGEGDASKVAKNIGWQWRKPMLIPGSGQRYLLVGCPHE